VPFLNTSSSKSKSSLSPSNIQLFHVSLFFSLGFFMTNISFANTVPSLVETIKSAEPISSAIIATIWKLEQLGNSEIISLITIVFGVLLSTLLSSSSSSSRNTTTNAITITSFIYVLTSNICFSFRGLHQKILQQTTTHGSIDDMNDVVLQYRMQCIGCMLFIIPAFIFDSFSLLHSIWNVLSSSNSESGVITFGKFLLLSLCNGFAFASYKLRIVIYLFMLYSYIFSQILLNFFCSYIYYTHILQSCINTYLIKNISSTSCIIKLCA